MPVSVVPALVDALVAAAQVALPSVLVIDGLGTTDDPGDYLMVGVDDPETLLDTVAAENEQTFGAQGPNRLRTQNGIINCSAMSWNGNSGNAAAKQARDTVQGIAETLAAACRATPGLGVTNVLWTSYGTRETWRTLQDPTAGVMYVLNFSIAFHAERT